MRSLTITFLLFIFSGLLVTLSAAQSLAAPDSGTQPTSTAAATSISILPTSSSPAPSSSISPTSRSSTSPSKPTSSKPSATATVPGPSGTNYGPKGPPDVLLHIPELHVGRIELDVNNLRADIALAAEVASLVQLNAGVQVGIDKVNITIADVDANLDKYEALGSLVNVVTNALGQVVQAVVVGAGGGGGGGSSSSSSTVKPTTSSTTATASVVPTLTA